MVIAIIKVAISDVIQGVGVPLTLRVLVGAWYSATSKNNFFQVCTQPFKSSGLLRTKCHGTFMRSCLKDDLLYCLKLRYSSVFGGAFISQLLNTQYTIEWSLTPKSFTPKSTVLWTLSANIKSIWLSQCSAMRVGKSMVVFILGDG